MLSVFLVLVVFFHHLDYDCQGKDEWCIHVGGYIHCVAIAEDRELATNLSQQVTLIVAHGEIPAPNVTIDVKDYAVGSLHFEALAEKAELLVYVGPELTIAVDFVAWLE